MQKAIHMAYPKRRFKDKMLNAIPREEIYQVISSPLLFIKVFDQISAVEVYANYIPFL